MKIAWKLMFLLLVALFSLVACGAAESDVHTADSGQTLDVDYDDSRADSPGTWKVKTTAMTMWLDSALQPHFAKGQNLWVAQGRVSKTITGFRAYTADGEHFQASTISARKFEVIFTPEQVQRVIAGERIYFDFFAVAGRIPIYHGTARYAPRFGQWWGSNRLFVLRAINPVVVGSQVRFRARATARAGHELSLVYTDDDAGPLMAEESPRKYRLDWTPADLLLAANPPEDPVHFRVTDTLENFYEKRASIELRLVQIGLTTDGPLETWPRMECEDPVRDCLRGLEGTLDTEECGYANEVQACFGAIEDPLAADEDRFVEDLRRELERWYERHEDDVRAMGGRTLEGAQQAVDPDDVGQLAPLEEGESFDYDPDYYDIFYHVDPVFPGSDRVWYGVYEPSGLLRSIFAVN